jgi:hypothetical protein
VFSEIKKKELKKAINILYLTTRRISFKCLKLTHRKNVTRPARKARRK